MKTRQHNRRTIKKRSWRKLLLEIKKWRLVNYLWRSEPISPCKPCYSTAQSLHREYTRSRRHLQKERTVRMIRNSTAVDEIAGTGHVASHERCIADWSGIEASFVLALRGNNFFDFKSQIRLLPDTRTTHERTPWLLSRHVTTAETNIDDVLIR